MLITTLVLLGFGILAVFSADGWDFSLSSLAFKQLLFSLLGLIVMVTLMAFDYRFLKALALPLYLGGLALLLLLIPFGSIWHGARRWYDIGPTSFQPSEPGKIAMLVALAAFVASRGVRMRHPLNFAASGIIAAIPALIIFEQPDLGTALIYVAIWCGIVAVSRTRPIYLLATALAAIPAFWVGWRFFFHDYQKVRLLVFRDPYNDGFDGLGEGMNIIQARITIAQAGLAGHRLSEVAGRREFDRLFASESDFAFAHAIGNFGFIGAVALFVCFLLLIWRYLRVAHLARDEFGQLIAIGAAAMLFFQAFVNIGMNVNVLPVVGIPLPFISAGSTSLVTMFALQGILQSILMHRHRLAFNPE
jgi:rod shape determining protein RodA